MIPNKLYLTKKTFLDFICYNVKLYFTVVTISHKSHNK